MAVRFTKPEINVREKLAELDKPSGIAGEAMLRAQTPQEQQSLLGVGRKNLIINGSMQVSQRGTSFGPSLTADQYLLDRWFFGGTTSNLTVTQETGVSIEGNLHNTFKASASGTASLDIYQAIEDWRYLSGKTVTISFWYRTNTEGFIIRHYNTEDVATLDNTNEEWTYRSIVYKFGTTVSNPRSANGGTLGFWKKNNGPLINGQYIEWTNYQIEVGKVASPFEHRLYGEELALCQRYYHRITNSYAVNQNLCIGVVADTDDVFGVIDMPVTMRTPPSVTVSAASSFRVTTVFGAGSQNCSQLTAGYDGVTHVTIRARGNAGGFTVGEAKLIGFNETVGLAYIDFDAEL